MLDKFKRGTDWHVRMPDGKPLNLNTEAAADLVLGLWETIEHLETRLHQRQASRSRKRSTPNDRESDA